MEPGRQSELTLWSAWLLATTVGFGAAAAIELVVAYAVGLPIALAVSLVLGFGFFNPVRFAVSGALGGYVFAFAQALALRRRFPPTLWWFHSVALSFALVGSLVGMWGMIRPDALQTTTLESDSLVRRLGLDWGTAGLLGYPGTGIILGFAQWFALRRHLHGAAWWILANGLAFALASLIYRRFDFIQGHDLGVFVLWPVIGAVTGAMLVWRLRRSASQPSSG